MPVTHLMRLLYIKPTRVLVLLSSAINMINPNTDSPTTKPIVVDRNVNIAPKKVETNIVPPINKPPSTTPPTIPSGLPQNDFLIL